MLSHSFAVDEGTLMLLLPAFTIMGLLWAGYELWKRGHESTIQARPKISSKSPQHTTKAMALKPRSSLLDTHGNVILLWRKPDGRGSLDHPNTLGWINFVFVLAFLGIFNELTLNYMQLGRLLNSEQARIYGNIVFRAHQLLPSMAAMTFTFLLGFPLVRIIMRGHEWSTASRVLQYTLLAAILMGSVAYTRSDSAVDFPFTHKAAVLMQACVLCMKLHSYVETNREYGMIKAGLWKPKHILVRQPTPTHDGPSDDEDGASDNSTALPLASSVADDVKAAHRRSRSRSHQAKQTTEDLKMAVNTSHGALSTGVQSESHHLGSAGDSATESHSDDHSCCTRRSKQLSHIVEEFTHLDAAWTAANALDFARRLVAPGQSGSADGVSEQVRAQGKTDEWDPEEELYHVYPNNVTLYDMAVFLCMPTLVYSPKYPRTLSVNWAYVAEKLLLAAGTLTICVIIVANYVAPVLENAAQIHPAEAIVRTIIPFCLLWLAFFYIVFECICNGFAELTRLGDRAFYSNWWDSTTFTYFSRTWNRPVHEWLLKHCYIAAQNAGLKASQAQYLTFGVSILVHEIVINGMFGFISPWLLLFSCFQFPLMSIMRASVFKGKRLGNFVFWIGLILGVPLISVLYSREYCIRHPGACAASA